MRLKSPSGGKTDAEDEPLAFRSGVFIFVVHFGGAGCGYQADGSGPAALWDLHVRLFSAGAVRAGMGDVCGAWIARGGSHTRAGGFGHKDYQWIDLACIRLARACEIFW